jgi:hypothetical protein
MASNWHQLFPQSSEKLADLNLEFALTAHKWEWLFSIIPMPTKAKNSKLWNILIRSCGLSKDRVEFLNETLPTFPKKWQLYDGLSYMAPVGCMILFLLMGLGLLPFTCSTGIVVFLSLVSIFIFALSRGIIFSNLHYWVEEKHFESASAKTSAKDALTLSGMRYTFRIVLPTSIIIALSSLFMNLMVNIIGLNPFHSQIIILISVFFSFIMGIFRNIKKHKSNNLRVLEKHNYDLSHYYD